ncbi:outer membrane protein [Allosphingosinicella vermicomposti]|uniref:outer membrane protein n=1 Tax=Allosphingosinicella vermicomposti TaxID=614671 RepID=UPI001FE236BA|nr:porin family protein [Allosphingosinicella vermicomposti]
MKFAFITAAAVAALTSTSAFAADITGARVEGVIGYDSPKDGTGTFDSEDVEVDFDIKLDGIVYGVGLGYDFAVSPTLALGVDAEISDSSSDFEIEEEGDFARLSLGRDLYVGGRVTTAVSDKFNLYGKIGYTNTRIKFAYDFEDEADSASTNLDGVRVGVGGQYAVAGNTYVGLEYRYSNYEADVSRHQVAASLGFRF